MNTIERDIKAAQDAMQGNHTAELTVNRSPKPGEMPSFAFKTPGKSVRSGDTYRIWYSAYNRNKPWRTAKLEKNDRGIESFRNHASHESVESAVRWLSRLD